jgi:ketosteroid isomerase-like protein
VIIDKRSQAVATVAVKETNMRHTPLFPILVFVAGFGTGFLARSPSLGAPQRTDTHAADLAAIEKLHQKDIEVTLSQDPKGLIDIWTEDAVRYSLNPGSPPVVGKQAIGADNQKGRAENPGFKVLSYEPKYKGIQIAGSLACELFEGDAKFKLSPEGQPESWRGTGIRVLRRESDNSWKFAVLIWDR